MLEIRNVTKVYQNGGFFTALNDVNIKFGDKGLVIILGKSGCGKSTLLNIMGGLDKATSGEVIINGKSTRSFRGSDFDAYRNTYVGIVFQEFNLIDEMTVFENISMTLKLQHKNTDVNTVDEVLAMVGLGNLGYRKPNELSGGQRQRVALARALIKRPEIILADEPTGSLDVSTSEDVFESLKKISQTKLVIIVTHEKDLATKYGDRIIGLVDGRVVSDQIRVRDSFEQVRELSDNVIEVSNSCPITKEQLNSKLIDGKDNYIGLSGDKEKITLAYSDTVDSIYEKSSDITYVPTTEKDIADDKRTFSLTKGKFASREAIGMARASIKRYKKRYRLLTRLTAVCFTFVMVAIMLGALSPVSIAVNSAFEKGATPLFAVSKFQMTQKYGDSYKIPAKFDTQDFETIKREVDRPYAKHMGINLAIKFAQKVTKSEYDDPWQQYSGMGSFGISSFNGVLEGASATELGLKLIKGGGTDKISAMNEIVISDMVAYEFIRYGFVGEDATGVYGIHTPTSMTDLIGCKIIIDKTELTLKIVGIFETNYADYKDLNSSVAYSDKTMTKQKEFDGNKDFLYGKIFASEGFAEKNALSSSSSQRYLNYNFRSETSGSSFWYQSMETPRFVPMAAEDYLWMKGGVPPQQLGDNEIIISQNQFTEVVRKFGSSLEELEAYIKTPEFSSFIDGTFSLNIEKQDRNYTINILNRFGMKIVGIARQKDMGNYDSSMMLSNSVIEEMVKNGAGNETIYFNKGDSFSLMSKMKTLEKSQMYGGSAKTSAEALVNLESMIDVLQGVFTGAATIFLILCFLVTFYYMSASVKFRSKEIAVYRVVGAKSWDVARIFLAENLFAAIKTTIWASIFTYFISNMLNTFVMSFLAILGVGSNLVTFSIFTPVLIFVIAFAFLVLSSLIPIMRLVTRKPVDAMKMV